MKNSVTLLLFVLAPSFSLFAEKLQSVQYIFPLDQSQFVSRSSEIIVRPGGLVDAASVSTGLFTVVGDKSGERSGQW